jgi:hypothetical protein
MLAAGAPVLFSVEEAEMASEAQVNARRGVLERKRDRCAAKVERLTPKIERLRAQLAKAEEDRDKARNDWLQARSLLKSLEWRCEDCGRWLYNERACCVLDAEGDPTWNRHRCDKCHDKAKNSPDPAVRLTATSPKWAKTE